MHKACGGEIEVDFNTIDFKTQHFDECTGEPLPNHVVRAAMIEEMLYFSEKAAWTAADWADMESSKDSTFVRMRWVLCNKGDLKEPDVRARLVAGKVAKDQVSAFDANTPPLESKKAPFSRYAASAHKMANHWHCPSLISRRRTSMGFRSATCLWPHR